MKTKNQRISAAMAKRVGGKLGVDWAKVGLDQFRRGLEVELEHGARDPQTNVTTSRNLHDRPGNGKVNGPEATWPWQGSSGPWRGYYFTHMEGSLRTPFIIRWPNHIPAGRVSNEIVHEVDTYTTFAKIAGASVPRDRAIDGVDQTDFLLSKFEKSNREGFPVFVADRLEAVKWKNWKVVFYDEQRDWWTPPQSLETRRRSISSLTQKKNIHRQD
jgi:arylsulfatase A-like enzyme